jgi:guanylate kinase
MIPGSATQTRGVIISGLLGVGKTTLLRLLAEEHGFYVPPTTTTRPISSSDFALINMPEDKFVDAVVRKELLFPMIAGNTLYAWDRSAVASMSSQARIAISVRPYTALSLASMFSDLVPVWLYVDETERQRRLSGRSEQRDRDPNLSAARAAYDREDAGYSKLFSTQVEVTAEAHLRLVHLYEDG